MFRTLFFLLLAFALLQPAYSQRTEKPNGGVLKTVSDYDAAWNAKDVETVSRVLSESYVYFTSTGGTSDRKATLEFLAMPSYKLTFVERSEIKVHTNDGVVAVVSSRWKGKGTWSGGEINDDQRCGQIFKREKGVWKMIVEHCVQIPPK